MTSNTLSTSNTTELDLSEDERNALKKHITEKIQGLNIESSMSMGIFFSLIEIVNLGSPTYSIENIAKWNTWVRGQKEICIEKSRANATTMPKVNMDKIQEFLKTLSDIGLLDQANGTALSITTKVSHITS